MSSQAMRQKEKVAQAAEMASHVPYTDVSPPKLQHAAASAERIVNSKDPQFASMLEMTKSTFAYIAEFESRTASLQPRKRVA